MFDTIIATASTANATNVVSHDISATATTSVSAKSDSYKKLENLIVQRQVWEDTVFKASNDRLYSILQDCYTLYTSATTKDECKALLDALDQHANFNGFAFKSSTHTLTKIVKCVFGAERRRASAYSIALRTAHAQRVKAENLPDFIREKGGVEEVRLAKSNAMKPAEKAVKAAEFVSTSELAVVQTPAVSALLDTAKIDEFIVLVAQQGADGGLTIKAVVNSKTVVDAALASVYSQNSKDIKSKTAETAAVADAQFVEQAINTAVNSVTAA